MSVATAQAIAGVSANRESEIEAIYPSVAAGGLGQVIGMIMGLAFSVPTTPLRILAFLVLGSLCAPLGLLAYLLSKAFGTYYVLTNRSIIARKIIGGKQTQQIGLSEIDHIDVRTQGGYEFHRVGDIVLENAQGNAVMTIPAVSFPLRLKQIILDARTARLESDQSFAHIQGRQS